MIAKMTRRALIAASCLSLAASAVAQTIVLGGQTSYRDLTIRSTYTIPITSTGSFPHIARWTEMRRGRLWLRNPAGSPGSIRIGTKAGTQNKAIDTSGGTALYTLAPGEELYEENGGLLWLAWSADTTAPADLTLIIEVECLTAPATLPVSTVKRSITASGRKLFSLSNVGTYADAGLIGPSKDGSTIYRRKAGASGTLGWASAAAFAADPANVVWTYSNNAIAPNDTIANSGLTTVYDTQDGEILVGKVDFGSFGSLWRSSGWSTNRQTATFTKVLDVIGGKIDQEYSLHQWAARGSTIWVAASGGQTGGGAGNASNDASRATRVWRSDDNGLTWVVDFDLRDYSATQGIPYPAGVHIHGIAYDPFGRVFYVCFGDDTGQGRDIAGLAFAEVVWRADGSTAWTKMPLPDSWKAPTSSTNTNQYIAAAPLRDVVLFSADVSKPIAPFAMRRDGTMELLGSTDSPGLNGRITRMGGVTVMTGVGSNSSRPAGTYRAKAMLGADDLSYSEVSVPQTLTATGSVGTRWGFVVGSKLILQLTGAGASFVVADLAYS
ncbi:MAG TPA: hypothetical protein H9899_11210 [Candidatus Sphingomonas excrementigallinarum]|nr:hypothetical protein [Candidatus Sphingomonas excrementigallinarum]